MAFWIPVKALREAREVQIATVWAGDLTLCH